MGAKLRNRFQRCCLLRVTRSTRSACGVGLGGGEGRATPPQQKAPTAQKRGRGGRGGGVLTAILSPKREASRSVTRRPSRKLKMTPHIQPSDSPLKNNANTLNGRGRHPKRTKESSATKIETRMNFRRPSLFSSEISLIPINLDTIYPNIWMMLVAIL